MHHIYTTPAFIIHSTPYGEAGKFILLFTREFGMIGALAQGIRLNKSKLRYHLQDYDYSNVSIVRGKEIWRITGAGEIEGNSRNTVLRIKVLKLLKRLLHGEEKNERLFALIKSLYENNIEERDQDIVECLIIMKILDILGYIQKNKYIEFLEGDIYSSEMIDKARDRKKDIVSAINLALRESHL